MTAKVILIYGGLFVAIWILFKLFRRKENPFKKTWFWLTYIISSVGLTSFFVYLFISTFAGPPPKEGWNREYYENGEKQTEFFVKNGKVNGSYKTWYPNGQLKFYSQYEEGKEVDTSYIYYETGQVMLMEIFKNSNTIYKVRYYPDGQKDSEYYNPVEESEDNFRIDYYPDGTKKFKTRISNSTFEGDGFYYFRNENIQYKGKYKDGQKNGVWFRLDSITGQVVDSDTFDFNRPRKFKTSWD